VAAVITSNTRLATMPGNVFIPAAATGLPRGLRGQHTALVTLDKTGLGARPATFLIPSWTTSTADSADRFPCSKAGTQVHIAPRRAHTRAQRHSG
jgi:hypothetical protein